QGALLARLIWKLDHLAELTIAAGETVVHAQAVYQHDVMGSSRDLGHVDGAVGVGKIRIFECASIRRERDPKPARMVNGLVELDLDRFTSVECGDLHAHRDRLYVVPATRTARSTLLRCS